MKIKIIALILALALMLSGWASPPQNVNGTIDKTVDTATTYSLIVNNKTGQTITLNLVGPQTYIFTVYSGKNTFTVESGKYRYSYDACNGTKKGTVVVTKNNKLLTLAACKAQGKTKQAKTVKFTVDNATSGYMRLVLTGPANYDFQLQTGKNVLMVIKGKYTYTAYGCGATKTGTINIRQGLRWRFWCF